MQKTRNKRLKTDYAQPSGHNSTFIDQMRQESSSQQRRFSSLSKHEPYITRILQSINHEVKYEKLDEAGIKEEREGLKQKIKDMNLVMTKMVEREVERDREESRISRKAVVTRDMGMDYNGLCKEYLHNTHKIHILQEEFNETNDKLMALCNPDTKMTNIRKLAEVEAKIKEMREQLGRIRKNKFLREKEMVKTKVKDSSELQDLQFEYITQSKKEENLLSRLQNVQQELADTEFGLAKQKEYMQEIKYECLEYADDQPVNQQHMELLYKTHKKKLELNMKRHEREEETRKRKYYHLLLEFQNLKNRCDQIDNKIYITEQQSAEAANKIQTMFEAFKDKKAKINHRRSLHAATANIQNNSGFITEFKDSRHRKDYDTLSNVDDYNEDAVNQKKFNKGNANQKSRIKSKNMGSIVRQKLTTPISEKEPSKSFLDRQNQRYYDQSRPLQHIPHFKTESTPQIHQESLKESSISVQEQLYGEDFEV